MRELLTRLLLSLAALAACFAPFYWAGNLGVLDALPWQDFVAAYCPAFIVAGVLAVSAVIPRRLTHRTWLNLLLALAVGVLVGTLLGGATLHSAISVALPTLLLSALCKWAFRGAGPNNSFKPKTNRYAIVFGLIQALGRTGSP